MTNTLHILSAVINSLTNGFFTLPWWGYVIYTLVLTQITIFGVTIYLHRHQAHRALDLHPIVSHFFRLWLWLSTGMVTKEWAAIHRKHHAYSDKQGDPHSPHVYGIKKILSEGAELYQLEANNQETLEIYGKGTPDDWIERNLYSKYSMLGVAIMLITNLCLFGAIGLSIWAIQMLWIPIHAAGIINGIGHYFGYRNFPSTDKSTNIIPFAFWIGGEELHNNHHTFATSAKFSFKWYEVDIGWGVIRVLQLFGLAKVKRTIPALRHHKAPKLTPDLQTLEAIITNRYNLMVRYAKLLKGDCKKELARLQTVLNHKIKWQALRRILTKDDHLLTNEERSLLAKLASQSRLIDKIVSLRCDLGRLWQRSNLTKEELLHSLQNWCKNAEASGINKLKLFSRRLKACY